MGTVFFDADGDKDLDLYVVSGGSEYEEGNLFYQDRLYINDGKGNFSRGELPVTASSGSCVAVYDFDADGDLDIFRGGEVLAHKYPYSPRSYLMVNEKGKFLDKTSSVAPLLQQAGMVKSAVWADMNGDKKAELIIAGEWMPIRIFETVSGQIKEVSSNYGLQYTEGWWNKLLVDDIDGDGDMDWWQEI
jgi:hypothetical protein